MSDSSSERVTDAKVTTHRTILARTALRQERHSTHAHAHNILPPPTNVRPRTSRHLALHKPLHQSSRSRVHHQSSSPRVRYQPSCPSPCSLLLVHSCFAPVILHETIPVSFSIAPQYIPEALLVVLTALVVFTATAVLLVTGRLFVPPCSSFSRFLIQSSCFARRPLPGCTLSASSRRAFLTASQASISTRPLTNQEAVFSTSSAV